MAFLISNLVLCMALLLFLRQIRLMERESRVERRLRFPPLLTESQHHLLFVGINIWLLSLAFRLVDMRVESVEWSRTLHLLFELAFSGATMYVVLGLMYFAAFPIQEGRPAPRFRQTDVLRRAGLLLLVGIAMIGVLVNHRGGASARLALWVLLGWQLLMVGHTYYNLRFSIHALRGAVIFTLIIWVLFSVSVFVWREPWIVETLLLLSLLTLLLRATFIYIVGAHQRAESSRREKEVMISFLRKVTGAEEDLTEAGEQADRWAGSLNLDQVLRVTLNFALGLTRASAGAIFLLGRLDPREEDPSQASAFLRTRIVEGPYPPFTDISRLPLPSLRVRHLNELLMSERIPIEGSYIGRVVKTGLTLFVPDAITDSTIPQQQEEFLKIKSLLAVPLSVRGEVVGVICVINRKAGTEPFTEEDERLLEAMAEQAAITIGSAVMHRELQEKDRLEREMELAREVQQLLLPAGVPQVTGYDFGAYSLAARQVGGDYYDFIRMDENRLALVVADVSGKGVPGALTMAMVRSALQCICADTDSAKELLVRLNDFVARAIRRDMFISMLVAVLHTQTRKLEVCRAGHDPLILIRAGSHEPQMMAPAGIVLGLVDTEDFQAHTEQLVVQLDPGDTLVFYTDGITEAMNPRGEEYSLDRLLRKLLNVCDQPPRTIIEQVNREVQEFSSGVPQHDDLTMMVLKVCQSHIQELSVSGSR